MKINRRFPIQDFVDVEIGEEVLRVKYKFPSFAQAHAIAEESSTGGVAMALCKYCIEEIGNLIDENEKKIEIKASDGCLSDESVVMLFNADLVFPLALFYRKHIAPSETDKKKYTTLPPPPGAG
jgi:hypothetical protein